VSFGGVDLWGFLSHRFGGAGDHPDRTVRFTAVMKGRISNRLHFPSMFFVLDEIFKF
jgi:hypothetical protein